MQDLTGLVAVLAPFVMVVAIVRMKHQQKMRALNLQTMSATDQQIVAELHSLAERLEARVGALERVLDAELAGWRSRMPL